jgi:flavin reductase (DIM6/NTAB) family NADH-FMN oxidoreductase RutF
MSEIDVHNFRRALGSFVTGVTIVTARGPGGEPVGLTVNSFNSVSLDPPLVLWSLALRATSLPSFREAKSWAVHVLAAGQEEMSARFATPGADRFCGLDLRDGPEGAPQLPGFAARFGCEATFEYEGGDHAIFVGHVVDLQLRDAEPLVFHGGRYSRVGGGLFSEEDGVITLTADGRAQIELLVERINAGVPLRQADQALLRQLG